MLAGLRAVGTALGTAARRLGGVARARALPGAPGKARRGQGTGSQRSRSLDRQHPNAHKREKDNDRRKERAGKRLVTKGAELLQEKHPDEAKKNPGAAAQWFD